MNIIVCINHVPDTEARIKVAADNFAIDRTGVNYMLGPYDEIAIEEGLRIRDKFKGEVVAMSLGGDAHKETLRKALAMGVDKAVLLKDDGIRDSHAVAFGLAEEIKCDPLMSFCSGSNPLIMMMRRSALLLQKYSGSHRLPWLSKWRSRMGRSCARLGP